MKTLTKIHHHARNCDEKKVNRVKTCPKCDHSNPQDVDICEECGANISDVSGDGKDPLIGTLLVGKFRIQELIGQGAMGRVYKATQEPINREVAIKIMHQHLVEDQRVAKRFRREAEAASRFTHPNSIGIFDFGQTESDSLYIAMEYIVGEDLAEIIAREGPMAPERVVRIATQTLSALHLAHANRIIHRDLKPENIMLADLPGQPDFVKVCDFGIAKIQQPAGHGESALTMFGMICGTPYYMSPEQAKGEDLDGRTDLYSMGVILYEMLTGEVPFRGATPVEVIARHLTDHALPPSKVRPDLHIPKMLEDIVMRTMSKQRDHRFSNAQEMSQELERALKEAEFQADLERVLQEADDATPPPPVEDPFPPVNLTAPASRQTPVRTPVATPVATAAPRPERAVATASPRSERPVATASPQPKRAVATASPRSERPVATASPQPKRAVATAAPRAVATASPQANPASSVAGRALGGASPSPNVPTVTGRALSGVSPAPNVAGRALSGANRSPAAQNPPSPKQPAVFPSMDGSGVNVPAPIFGNALDDLAPTSKKNTGGLAVQTPTPKTIFPPSNGSTQARSPSKSPAPRPTPTRSPSKSARIDLDLDDFEDHSHSQKSRGGWFFLILILLAAGVGGYFLFRKNTSQKTNIEPKHNNSPTRNGVVPPPPRTRTSDPTPAPRRTRRRSRTRRRTKSKSSRRAYLRLHRRYRRWFRSYNIIAMDLGSRNRSLYYRAIRQARRKRYRSAHATLRKLSAKLGDLKKMPRYVAQQKFKRLQRLHRHAAKKKRISKKTLAKVENVIFPRIYRAFMSGKIKTMNRHMNQALRLLK